MKKAVATIQVWYTSPDTGQPAFLGQGNGFAVGTTGLLVTARHVIDASPNVPGTRRYDVTFGGTGAPFHAQRVGCASDLVDVCVIRLAPEDLAAAGILQGFELSCRIPAAEDSIAYYARSPGALASTIRDEGKITGEMGVGNNYPSNIQITPGDSGGPILYEDKVIGLNRGAYDTNLAYVQALYQAWAMIEDDGLDCPKPAATPAPLLQSANACPELSAQYDFTLGPDDKPQVKHGFQNKLSAKPGCLVKTDTHYDLIGPAALSKIDLEPSEDRAWMSINYEFGAFREAVKGSLVVYVEQEDATQASWDVATLERNHEFASSKHQSADVLFHDVDQLVTARARIVSHSATWQQGPVRNADAIKATLYDQLLTACPVKRVLIDRIVPPLQGRPQTVDIGTPVLADSNCEIATVTFGDPFEKSGDVGLGGLLSDDRNSVDIRAVLSSSSEAPAKLWTYAYIAQKPSARFVYSEVSPAIDHAVASQTVDPHLIFSHIFD